MRIPRIHEYRLDKSDQKQKYDYKTIQVDLKPSEYVDDLDLFEDENSGEEANDKTESGN